MKNIIGENIRRYRAARGFTQNELAILLSVSPQAVSRWENGQAFPDISMLTPIAKFLNVSIDELMGTEVQRNRMLSD
jgi:transcriptional regulator with XRE-family HTH domain